MCLAGELSREEDVLEWLVQNKSTGDDEEVIEDVTAKTLNTLIGNIDSLAVLFCKFMATKSLDAPKSRVHSQPILNMLTGRVVFIRETHYLWIIR